MAQRLLDGLRVLDLGRRPGRARAARVLGDLGAEVVARRAARPATPDAANVARAWNAGKHGARARGRRSRARRAARRAPTSCSTRRAPRVRISSIRAARPTRSGCASRRSGATGPRAAWRVTDLGVMAASGNMYDTGDPDRAPVRSHRADGVRAHRPGSRVRGDDRAGGPAHRSASTSRCKRSCSSRTWSTPARFPRPGSAARRRGANIGRTREIWPTLDGFVSFGLRGGKARVPSLEMLTKLVATLHRRRRARSAGTGPTSTRTPPPTRSCSRSSNRSPRTSRRTRCRSSTTSRARRTSCSHPRTRRARSTRRPSSRRATSSARSAMSSSSRSRS